MKYLYLSILVSLVAGLVSSCVAAPGEQIDNSEKGEWLGSCSGFYTQSCKTSTFYPNSPMSNAVITHNGPVSSVELLSCDQSTCEIVFNRAANSNSCYNRIDIGNDIRTFTADGSSTTVPFGEEVVVRHCVKYNP